MIHVLVADAFPIVHKGIKAVFKNSTEISISGKAFSTEDLFEQLEKKHIDIIILELDLPTSDGITALRIIKNRHPEVRVVVFSNQPENVYAISALKAGASGYLNKKASVNYLRDAVLKVSSGGVYITNQLAQSIAFDETTGRSVRSFKKLSLREIEVLKLLCNGKRNKEVAFELNISEKTVSTYRLRIMSKLRVNNIVQLIRKAQNLHLDTF